jgi:hypothetical protein
MLDSAEAFRNCGSVGNALCVVLDNVIWILRSLVGWSVEDGLIPTNPCREIKLPRAGEGYDGWTWSVIETATSEPREAV